MTITDITKPIEKKFNLELDENELQLLGLIVGSISYNRLDSFFEEERWRLENYPTIKKDEGFVDDLFGKITKIARKF